MVSRRATCRTVTTPGSRASALPMISTGTGKTVLRGGSGMFYERVQGNDVYNAALNPPFAYQPNADERIFLQPEHQRFDRRDEHQIRSRPA